MCTLPPAAMSHMMYMYVCCNALLAVLFEVVVLDSMHNTHTDACSDIQWDVAYDTELLCMHGLCHVSATSVLCESLAHIAA
jgi:hypothetical protein